MSAGNSARTATTATRAIRAPSVHDVEALLLPGPNTVAVALAAGVDNGVELQLHGPQSAPAWSRSSFSGFVQILVETTARGRDRALRPRRRPRAATAELTASPATPRRSLE